MQSTPAYVSVTTAVVSGVIVFILGQIFQQHILEPIREFRRQQADAIYFALHFIELVNEDVTWDGEDKKAVKQMHAALIQSMELRGQLTNCTIATRSLDGARRMG